MQKKKLLRISLILVGMLYSSESIGSGKQQDEHDKKYSYRGSAFAPKEERKAWDAVNKEFASQDRASEKAREARKK